MFNLIQSKNHASNKGKTTCRYQFDNHRNRIGLIYNQACADAALTPFLQYLGFFLLMEALIIIMIEKILIKFPRISGKPLKNRYFWQWDRREKCSFSIRVNFLNRDTLYKQRRNWQYRCMLKASLRENWKVLWDNCRGCIVWKRSRRHRRPNRLQIKLRSCLKTEKKKWNLCWFETIQHHIEILHVQKHRGGCFPISFHFLQHNLWLGIGEKLGTWNLCVEC